MKIIFGGKLQVHQMTFKMNLNGMKSKMLHICSTSTPESQISLSFVVHTTISKIFAFLSFSYFSILNFKIPIPVSNFCADGLGLKRVLSMEAEF